METENGCFLEFDQFSLNTRQKVLWHKGEPVLMPLKELELLCLLIENKGQLVAKNEIIEKIWADSFVEESNLSRHVYLLRKKLKDLGVEKNLIENVPRRGYRFTGAVREIGGGTFVVERHSLTKTLIEEFYPAKTGKTKQLSIFRTRYFALGAVIISVFAASLIFWQYNRGNSAQAGVPRIKSIAILPFKTSENDFQGLGFADVLITRLSSVNGLTIRPTSAVMNFGDETSLGIGKKLDVDAVLEGSIYRTRKGVRITARLLSVREQTTLWVGQFEKSLEDEFKLQNEIALQLVNALSVNLTRSGEIALGKEYTDNAEAYRLYVEGRYHWNKRSSPGMSEAERLFRNAIEKDPEFALAYVGLADTLGMLENQKDAVSVIEKALEIDPDLAEAHATLGFSYMFRDWDWKNAEAEFERSIELNPGYATTHQWYATLLSIEGRFEEAAREMDLALEIHPTSYNFLADTGQVYYFAGDYEKAEEYCLKSLEIFPDFAIAHIYLADIYLLTANYDKSIDETYKYHFIHQDYDNHNSLNKRQLSERFAREAETFKRNGIRSYLENRLQDPQISPNVFYQNAQIYTFLGKTHDALENLEKAIQQKAFMAAFIKADPKLEPLRFEPRYQEMLVKMRLAD